MLVLLCTRLALAFVAPGPRVWSPVISSSGSISPSGPGDRWRVQGVQWNAPCLPLGRSPRDDVRRHSVVHACDRKAEEEARPSTFSLEAAQAAARAVVNVIFVLFNGVIRVATAVFGATPLPEP